MAQIRYKIEFSYEALEQLENLPKTMRERIARALNERLSLCPDERGKPLVREWADHRRLRIGHYRVIYKVIQDRFIVFIVEMDHRKDVYKLWK